MPQDQGVHNLLTSIQTQHQSDMSGIYKWQLALKDALKWWLIYNAVLMKMCLYIRSTFSQFHKHLTSTDTNSKIDFIL